jgi:HEAT repeat protein
MRLMTATLLAFSMLALAYAEGAEVRELIAKLKDKDSDVRRAAAKELSEFGAEAKDAVEALKKAVTDKDGFVRRFAAEALGNIGADAKSAVPALATALKDERKEVQLAAVDALGKIGDASTTALTAALKDTDLDPQIRGKAALGLGKIGKSARGAVPVLTGLLTQAPKGGGKKGNDNDFRVEVATALGKVAKGEDKEAITALKSVSEGKQRNKALAQAASNALKELTGSPAKKKQ